MTRCYNFFSFFSFFSLLVLELARDDMLEWHGKGLSLMEMSHRSPEVVGVAQHAEQTLRSLLCISDDYAVLFLQGGASTQFSAVPLNLLGDRRGRPWNVGIRDPRRRGEVAAVLPLADVAISTSGDYERYFEEDGVRHHHIINPRTGKSATGVRSVTIIGPDGITTEGLTKSVFVKGPKEGMRLIESLKGIDAIIIDDAGRMLYSPGLRDIAREAPRFVAPTPGAAR